MSSKPRRTVRKNREAIETQEPVNIEGDLAAIVHDNRSKILENRDSDLTDPRFKAAYNTIKDMIVGKQFNVAQFTILVPLAMQALSDVQSMTGDQKKDMIIRIFRYIVEELDFETVNQKRLAQNFVRNDLGTLIDTAYMASKGKFEFKTSAVNEKYTQEQFDLVYNSIRGMVVNQELDIKTIIILVPSVMMQVARFANMTGLQKRDLVTQLILQLVDEFVPNDENMAIVKLFIEKQLPNIIDILYRAAQSGYVFKKIAQLPIWKKICVCGSCQE
ncbi:MAG: hypothetical protein ACRC1D_05515 [Culicoidibacterales bacterium]